MRDGAVSEVIGAFVLVSIAVLAMTILVLVLYTNPLPTKVPSFSGLVSNRSTTIYISNEGGDPLLWGQYKILVDNVDETWNFTKSLPDPNRTFSLGKVMNATLPKMSSRVVMVFNTSWGGGTVLLSADLMKQTVLSGWYNPTWLYRKKITIDHTKVPSDQNSFPVLISLSDVDISAKAQHSGNDILFTSSDGVTKLSHEIESYTWNSGALVAWVKVPTLSSGTDTILYMYYANPAAGNQQDPTNVWDANYMAVWHLDEAGTGSATDYSDSTINANYGEGGGGNSWLPNQTPGKIASGQSFTPNDYIQGPNTPSLTVSSQLTMEAWVNLANANNNQKIVGKTSTTPGVNTGYGYILGVQTNGLYPEFWDSAQTGPFTFTSGAVPNTLWTYIAVTWTTGGNIIGYVNGAQVNSIPASGNGIGTLTNGLRIGVAPYHVSADQYFVTGLIDEVRISNTARPGSWIQTEYNNENNPGVGGFLLSVSTEQTSASMS